MTRSLRAIASVTLSAALVCSAASVIRAQGPNAASAAANSLFADAVAKESAVRKALAGDMAVPSVLKAVRTVIADYEAVVRRYPSSGFSDDALWRAAKLSREAFDAFHESREKTTAVRLLRQLAAGYPSSRFSPLTAAEMNWLNTNQSVVPATGTARAAQPPVQRALAVEPIPAARVDAAAPNSRGGDSALRASEAAARPAAVSLVEPARASETARTSDAARLTEVSAAKPPATLVNVKAVRRTVLPTVVRVVVELDAEVGYRDERLENPTRVFVDIPSTRANLALIDQTMRFDGDADIVRQIRIGRHPNNVTRVVLEGAGIASYSIYPLYNPYRLVIDCIRTTPAADAKADSPLASPATTVSLPTTAAPVASALAPTAPPASEVAKAAPVAVPPAPTVTPIPKPTRASAASNSASSAPATSTPAASMPAASTVAASTPPPPQTTTASTATTSPETEKPAWVETLRRRPGAAKTTNATTAALPPIPTPSLRSKPVSGTVPLPPAVVASLPAPVEPVLAKPVTAAPTQTASRETVAAKPSGGAPADIVPTKDTALASTAASAVASAPTVAPVPTPAAPPAANIVSSPVSSAPTSAAVTSAVETPSAPTPGAVASSTSLATTGTVAAKTPSAVAAVNTAAAVSPAVPVGSSETAADELDADLPTLATRSGSPSNAASPKPAERNLAGGLSMARQLGLGVSRIVIDAGHGGHDPGAQSHGVTEADLVLDVALRLEKLLSKIPGIEVLLTRRTDLFIPLQERTAIANREGADLFLSIHANASNLPSAQGIETYFLNFASNRTAAAVAARENATSGQTMGELQDVVKAIAASNKRDESRDFATYVQREMMNSLKNTDKGAKDLGVKQAPFVVLVGAAMPSILAEISFVTNPQEAKLLKQNAYRQKIAQALFEGVRRYQSSLKSTLAVAQQQN